MQGSDMDHIMEDIPLMLLHTDMDLDHTVDHTVMLDMVAGVQVAGENKGAGILSP
jgi:hypothetical protein